MIRLLLSQDLMFLKPLHAAQASEARDLGHPPATTWKSVAGRFFEQKNTAIVFKSPINYQDSNTQYSAFENTRSIRPMISAKAAAVAIDLSIAGEVTSRPSQPDAWSLAATHGFQFACAKERTNIEAPQLAGNSTVIQPQLGPEPGQRYLCMEAHG